MAFDSFKKACLEYAHAKGFELFPNNSMYLDNTQDTEKEIFDFSFASSAIKCYDTLYNASGIICSEMEYKVVRSFNEFKMVLDNLILNYKELKMENKINSIEKDFR